MVMIEAMALGCPVISFARGAAPEIVVHRKTGFLVHDVAEMVRFIPRIDEIDRNVTRMHVERNFSSRVMCEKYVKIYKNVIKLAKGSPVLPLSSVHTNKTSEPAIIKRALPAQLPQVARAAVEREPGP